MESLQSFMPFLLIIVVMYLFMILPQQKRAKKEKEFENNLKIGDKIVTKSGLHGRLNELADTTIVLETMSGKIKMERSAVSMELTNKINAKPAEKK
jgi:preprotein translocase subunit YajC